MKNRTGFTLTELMLYIVFFSFILLGFNKQIKLLINSYVYGKNAIKQQSSVQDVLTIMTNDISNTGLKVYINGGAHLAQAVASGVTVSSTDLSSFIHKQGNPNDTLIIYKAELNKADCGWLNIIDTITYYVNGTALLRKCKATGVPVTTDTIGVGICALQFEYGTNLSNYSVLDQSTITTSNWVCTNIQGTAPNRTDGTNIINLSFSASDTGYIKYSNTVPVELNKKYLVHLVIKPSSGFPKKLDSLSFSFRKSGSSTVIGSDKFLPRSDSLNLLIPVSDSGAAVYPVITYYAKGAGNLLIKKVKITCVESGAYSWVYDPSVIQKLNTRAIHVYILSHSEGSTGTKISKSVSVGDVTIPESGEVSSRLYDAIIETANNGNFGSSITTSSGLSLVDLRIRPILLSVQH